MTNRSFLTSLLLLTCLSVLAQTNPSVFENLKFRFIGPEGNRTIAIAGVPGDPMINLYRCRLGRIMENDRWRTQMGSDFR